MREDRKKEIVVEIGSNDSVTMCKGFGSMAFMNLRITPDVSSCSWIIERSTVLPCADPEEKESDSWVSWVEWCRIPAQFDWEFRRD